jgi:methionyl aminopeptidase
LVEDLPNFEKSGQIVARVREYVKSLSIQGLSVLQVCEDVEKRIRELGGGLAFPCNVGINEVAAHYTSPWNDKTMIPDGSLVKIDFGVEIDGCITDTSITLSLNPACDSLVLAAETALQEAISAVAPGRKLSDVGGIVEAAIGRYGFRPIRNLTGHKIERYVLHAGKSVPNVAGIDAGRFEVGEIYAIEPFATRKEAEGAVRERMPAYIFRFVRMKGARTESARDLAEHIQTRYKSLPFASRWIFTDRGYEKTSAAFQELLENRSIAGYPVLVERSGGTIAQAEHTLLVTRDGCKVLTV